MAVFQRLRTQNAELSRVQDQVALALRRIEDGLVLPGRFAATRGANRLSGAQITERYEIEAGATATLDYDFPRGREIVDVWLKKTNAAGGGVGSVQVQTSIGAAISDIMSINVADQTIVRAATIDDAQHRTEDGRVRFVRTRTASADESCIVYIVTMPVL